MSNLLEPAAPSIVGVSQEATCFVSLDSFTEKLAEILEEAAARRNGWKVIPSHCAPPKRRRSNATTPLEDRS